MAPAMMERALGSFLGLFLLVCPMVRADILPGRFFRFERLVPKVEAAASVGFSSVAQDEEGFLWFGTSAGLARFDGYNFKFFRPPAGDGAGLENVGIYPVTISRSGDIWLGTSGRGLLRFSKRTEQFVRFPHYPEDPGSLSDDIVLAVQEDATGDLWIGTRSRGLNRLDPDSGTVTRVPLGPEADVVWDVLADSKGAIWAGTLDAGLFRIDPATGATVRFRSRAGDPRSLGGNGVWTLFEDREGTVWIGTKNGGLNRYDPSAGGFTRFYGEGNEARDLLRQTISAIAEDTDGRLWLGTVTDGLRVLDRRTGECVAFRHDPQDPESLGDDNVTSIAQDASGLIWVGTVRGGLNKCLAGLAKFEHFKRNAWIPEASFTTISGPCGPTVRERSGRDREGDGSKGSTARPAA